MESSDKNSKLFKGILVYAIGNLGSKILNFFIVPLYTYYITSTDMGIYDLITSTMSMCFPLLTMQISDAAYRWLIRGGGEEYKKSTYQVVLFNSLIFCILIGIINRFVLIPYWGYIVIIMVTNVLLDTLQKMLRGVNNQRLFAISGVIYTFIFLTLNVLQICILKRGIESLF